MRIQMMTTALFAGPFIPRMSSGFSTRAVTIRHLKLRSASFHLFTSSSSRTNGIGGSGSSSATSDSVEQEYASTYHAPVMYKECIDALLKRTHNALEKKEKYRKKSNLYDTLSENNSGLETISHRPKIFIDGTLGGGGHSECLLESLSSGDVLIGCDVDPSALATASMRLKDYIIDKSCITKSIETSIFIPVRSNFRDLEENIRNLKHPVTGELLLEQDGEFTGVDGILLDLGISSHQIDNAERGFAFMKDGPLDMRMYGGDWKDHVSNKELMNSEFQYVENNNYNNKNRGLTAADICNNYSEQEIIQILKEYGDEPRAKQIARSIMESRPLSTTGDLKEAVAKVTPEYAKKGRRMGRTATLARVFQALRIVVNDEDKVLTDALEVMAPKVLKKGGRLVVLTYHSMEDRAVKRVMRDGSVEISKNGMSIQKDIFGNEIVVDNNGVSTKPFKPLGKKQKATDEEVEVNSRARSATLRVAERL